MACSLDRDGDRTLMRYEPKTDSNAALKNLRITLIAHNGAMFILTVAKHSQQKLHGDLKKSFKSEPAIKLSLNEPALIRVKADTVFISIDVPLQPDLKLFNMVVNAMKPYVTDFAELQRGLAALLNSMNPNAEIEQTNKHPRPRLR